MDFPDFFDNAPVVMLRDPLAAFLGAAKSGDLTYRYGDAVKLAGHSCPTVAGAYLMVRKGLAELYGTEMPQRGGVEVHMRDVGKEGTTGVIAAIATLLTGAAPETGFGGIGADHRFGRRGLLRFEVPVDGLMAMRRLDTGYGVVLDFDAGVVPADPEMTALFPKAVIGTANDDEQARFATLWQDRVARMLLEHGDDPELVSVREWKTTPLRNRSGLFPVRNAGSAEKIRTDRGKRSGPTYLASGILGLEAQQRLHDPGPARPRGPVVRQPVRDHSDLVGREVGYQQFSFDQFKQQFLDRGASGWFAQGPSRHHRSREA